MTVVRLNIKLDDAINRVNIVSRTFVYMPAPASVNIILLLSAKKKRVIKSFIFIFQEVVQLEI